MSQMLRAATEWAALQVQRMRIRRQFRRSLGYAGDFENPCTYQEKIQFRKLYGNHAFYARVADKYRVREYVAGRVGGQYLIPLLGVYEQLRAEDFATLPSRFIIKANHGCKWHEVVRDKSRLDVGATVRRFNRYLRATYGGNSGERHYAFIPARIVVEELLEGNTGGCPWDYSFFAYHSASGFDYNYAICAPDGRGATFSRRGELLDSRLSREELAPHVAPANFQEMVEVARLLSADFDFVRVDLYSVAERVYFGELTCTPHQGYGKIADPRRQKMRDEMWHLDGNNPLLYRAPASYRQHARPVRPRLQVATVLPRLP